MPNWAIRSNLLLETVFLVTFYQSLPAPDARIGFMNPPPTDSKEMYERGFAFRPVGEVPPGFNFWPAGRQDGEVYP